MSFREIAYFSPLRPPPIAAITQHHYDVHNELPQLQLLAWRERMGSMFDLLPSRVQVERPFQAWVNRYTVGNLSFADTYSDPVRIERSVARISTDRVCDYFLFAVCVEGDSHTMEGRYATRSTPTRTKILALDFKPLKRGLSFVLTDLPGDKPVVFASVKHRRLSAVFINIDEFEKWSRKTH